MEISGYKRRKSNGFAYPAIPVGDQDIGSWETADEPFTIRLIPGYPSEDRLRADTFRAESITHVNKQNEQLVRSYHPSLSSRERVWVSESGFGETVWLVDSPILGRESVYAGGRPIHYLPGDHYEYIPLGILTPRSPDKYNQHFARYINPRRFLRPADLDSLRELFPEAVGAEVLLAGFLVVLFENMQHVHDAYSEVWPLELAGLRVFFDITRYGFTTSPIQSGLGVSTDPSGEHHARAGCLGLKLRLQNGSMAITTVTHGFVYCPGASIPVNIFNMFQKMIEKAKRSLTRGMPTRVGKNDDAFVIPREVLTNDPVGRGVWLASSHKRIGAITRTYDQPSRIRPYLEGYNHDLCLISDATLPDIGSPPGYPTVTGWADYSAALDGQEVYVVCHQTNVARWRVIRGNLDSTLFKRAAVLGTGYMWDRKRKSQSSFLLWHTGTQLTPADGWSGAPLCLGRPSDTAAKAVVFQNFQRSYFLAGPSLNTKNFALAKAGFLLPPDVKSSTIVSADVQNRNKQFDTLPAANRDLFESES
ncbi:uncharacterized protein N7443_007847 [Penicillium atrosanguineum]|uniref:uncharacterized protein n=1 Tax=Penicillium atrosanguineum TaxID=1132637 RepID=UPI002391C01D|nr:uncharacterized protein N7443_007847 [Penicillium atrosanguineum]KAJ5296954.1 hypothetical protein N7443_007847 [Penicillium atrosanguineum]